VNLWNGWLLCGHERCSIPVLMLNGSNYSNFCLSVDLPIVTAEFGLLYFRMNKTTTESKDLAPIVAYLQAL